jgi:uncharacterized protein YegL
MTDKNLTEIVAIIDRSGSMQPFIDDTIGGFNSFVDEQRKTPGKAILTLVQFDDQYQIDYNGIDLEEVKPLNEETYVPRGWTALLDAIGKTINTVGERLSNTEEDKRPGQVIFLVITDGEENSSKEFTVNSVKEMVKHQTDAYQWSFVFLGGGSADFQKAQAMSMGFAAQNSYNYTANHIGTQNLYGALSRGVSRRRSMDADSINPNEQFLTNDEKDKLV